MKTNGLNTILLYLAICCLEQTEGKKRHCPELPSLQNGKIINVGHSIRKYVCNHGYTFAVKTSRFRRCNHSTGKWSFDETPRCVDKDECSSYTKTPCQKHARCINSVGSYRCVCKSGYKDKGRKCVEATFVNSNDCGIVKKTRNKSRKRVRRIIGGTTSTPGDWPWIAYITVNGGIVSGVLIKPNWVLTTANALYKGDGFYSANEVTVTLGEYNRNKPENEEQHFRAEKIFIHPRFNNLKSLDNDIALLKLDGSVRVTEYVNTICLTSLRVVRKFEKHFRKATIAGWGLTKPLTLPQVRMTSTSKKLYSGVLRNVEIPLIPSYLCGAATSYFYHRKTMLCAGSDNTNLINSPCLGDIGSPLIKKDPETKRWILLGLFSWSEGCGQPKKYSYYTRVSRYTEWINNITETKGNDL